jgi:hypothetical protein
MTMSAFFRALHNSYQAEVDDLTSDSEGKDVLRARLQEKRSQLVFLSQMMETAPEMVAVAFHGAFKFTLPAVMEQLLTLESDEFPDWESLGDAVQLAPWASDMAAVLLREPQGNWFMTVAATLEYLFHRPSARPPCPVNEDDRHDLLEQGSRSQSRHLDHGHDFDADDDHAQRTDQDDDEASADWLEGQGFDRKE